MTNIMWNDCEIGVKSTILGVFELSIDNHDSVNAEFSSLKIGSE